MEKKKVFEIVLKVLKYAIAAALGYLTGDPTILT